MSKPTIFFSHSSSDKDILLKLKELFCDKTGGTIDVFLSSDGQSIPLGKNWVHRVEEALNEAKIMIVFLTPNSLRSSWIYFEAGYVYSKDIRVIPVGFLGADISSVAPPLSLLQGFNIVNKDGLDNLISLANSIFSHNHKSFFSDDEYQSITLEKNKKFSHPLGDFFHLVNEIHIKVTEKDNLNFKVAEGIHLAKEIFEKNNFEYRINEKQIEVFGLTVRTTDGEYPEPINFVIDPALVDTTIEVTLEIIRKLRDDGIKDISIRFDFVDTIDCINRSHKITARLFGKGITLGQKDGLLYNGLNFTIDHLLSFTGKNSIKRGATYLSITPKENVFELSQVSDLLKILFNNGVLFETVPWIGD